MKKIDLSEIWMLARMMSYDQFKQTIKAELTDEPKTVVIKCEPVVVDGLKLNFGE